ATWAQTHSIWQTNISEWAYPPGSELFVAPFWALGARWSLPMCGLLPALLLATRLWIWGRSEGANAWACTACVVGFMATPVLAFEAGTLQNDVWLAAFFIEALWILERGHRDVTALAVTAMLKPLGWLFALLTLLNARKLFAWMALAFVPLALWVLRDLTLGRAPLVAPEVYPPYWPTTLAANVSSFGAPLVAGMHVAGWFTLLWLLLPVAGLFDARTRRVAVAGIAALVVFFFHPVAFQSSGINYLAAGTSLRYASCAMAIGALTLCRLSPRLTVGRISVAAIVGAVAAIAGFASVFAIFASDGVALTAAILGPLMLLPFVFQGATRLRVSVAIACCALVATATIAALRAPAFYADWMRGANGSPTGLFAWLSAERPHAVVTWLLRPGAVLMNSPTTFVAVAPDDDPCVFARGLKALFVVGTDRDVPPAERAARVARARACGRVLYEDGAVTVVGR
ncbi:MAG: hypothetical protein JOZ38_03115, partial [Candidatus Eremiobacteraeota bacterium]|nr:hypothetical protein [Candidatus Eremiobacteraeota bacterium]